LDKQSRYSGLAVLKAGLHNSESLKGQIDQHTLATGRKSRFGCSVEEILKGQLIIRSRAFATFSATEKVPAGRMLCRPALKGSGE